MRDCTDKGFTTEIAWAGRTSLRMGLHTRGIRIVRRMSVMGPAKLLPPCFALERVLHEITRLPDTGS